MHYRDFEHAYVYWIWLRGSASYVIIYIGNCSKVLIVSPHLSLVIQVKLPTYGYLHPALCIHYLAYEIVLRKLHENQLKRWDEECGIISSLIEKTITLVKTDFTWGTNVYNLWCKISLHVVVSSPLMDKCQVFISWRAQVCVSMHESYWSQCYYESAILKKGVSVYMSHALKDIASFWHFIGSRMRSTVIQRKWLAVICSLELWDSIYLSF